jgi:hypothetical protein
VLVPPELVQCRIPAHGGRRKVGCVQFSRRKSKVDLESQTLLRGGFRGEPWLRWPPGEPAHPFAARGASSVVQELRGPRAGVVAQVSALRGGSGVLEQVQRRDGAPQNKDLTVEQESPKWRPTPASDRWHFPDPGPWRESASLLSLLAVPNRRHDIVNIFVLSLLGSGAIAGVIWNSK